MTTAPSISLAHLRAHRRKTVAATTAVGRISHVHVASSFLARCIGLIGRRRLADDEGLLFVPGGSVHTMWMSFAIDIVFLDTQGIVLKVVADVAPWRLAFAPPRARYVLELDANRSAACGIVAGRTIVFEPP